MLATTRVLSPEIPTAFSCTNPIRADEFPKPRKASARRTCWLLREIEEWAESRPVSDLLPPPNTATGGRNGKPKARNALLVTQDAPID